MLHLLFPMHVVVGADDVAYGDSEPRIILG